MFCLVRFVFFDAPSLQCCTGVASDLDRSCTGPWGRRTRSHFGPSSVSVTQATRRLIRFDGFGTALGQLDWVLCTRSRQAFEQYDKATQEDTGKRRVEQAHKRKQQGEVKGKILSRFHLFCCETPVEDVHSGNSHKSKADALLPLEGLGGCPFARTQAAHNETATTRQRHDNTITRRHHNGKTTVYGQNPATYNQDTMTI